jgi:Tol biopolymer transport system component
MLVSLLSVIVSYTTAQPDFSDWSAPVNLGPVVNSTFNDSAPAISRDGLSLYFASTRPVGGFGANDLWVSERNSVEEPWGAPMNLGPVINTEFGELQAGLSRDGHWLFFASGRPPGGIWLSYRGHVNDNFAWQPPINVVPGSAAGHPSFFQNDDTGVSQLFFAGAEILVADLLPDGTIGPAQPVPELNTASNDRGPSVRFDGLEVFFISQRPGGSGASDLWTATRQTVFDPWSAPTNLGPLVNSVSADSDPDIAPDRETLYFHSARSGGFGVNDLYVTTRTKKKQ